MEYRSRLTRKVMKKMSKLELIAKKEMVYNEELYKLVDFLNKNLKNKQVIIGISKKDDKAIISVYET
jgi:hypothetical protein